MSSPIDQYLADKFGRLNVPADPKAQITMARALLGSSLVDNLDYWIDNALDKIDNPTPAEPYVRDNEFSRKDRYFREAFAQMDDASKEAVRKLICKTLSGLLFSMLVNFDQFDFGDLSISLLPKTDNPTPIEVTSPTEELHDETQEWIYLFSRFKDQLVKREETKAGIFYQLI